MYGVRSHPLPTCHARIKPRPHKAREKTFVVHHLLGLAVKHQVWKQSVNPVQTAWCSTCKTPTAGPPNAATRNDCLSQFPVPRHHSTR